MLDMKFFALAPHPPAAAGSGSGGGSDTTAGAGLPPAKNVQILDAALGAMPRTLDDGALEATLEATREVTETPLRFGLPAEDTLPALPPGEAAAFDSSPSSSLPSPSLSVSPSSAHMTAEGDAAAAAAAGGCPTDICLLAVFFRLIRLAHNR